MSVTYDDDNKLVPGVINNEIFSCLPAAPIHALTQDSLICDIKSGTHTDQWLIDAYSSAIVCSGFGPKRIRCNGIFTLLHLVGEFR